MAFDLDDTLAPERDFAMSGFRVIARMLAERYPALQFDSAALVRRLERALASGCTHYDILEKWLDDHGLATGELMPRLVEAARTHTPADYRLRSGWESKLKELQSAGVRMALITDGRSLTQRIKIKELGLDRYFVPQMILISGETGHGKEDPDNFRTVMRMYPEASGFIYVGDNPAKDFRQPNLLGWRTVMLALPPEERLHPQPESDFPQGASEAIPEPGCLKV